MRTTFLALALALALAAPAPAQDPTPDARAVLDRYVEALGGRAVLDALSIRVYTGRFVDDRPYRGPADTAAVLVRAPAGAACEIVRDGAVRLDGRGRDGLRGKLSWLLDPRGALATARDFPGLRHDGTTLVDGRPAHRLTCGRDPDHYALHFDAETGLLLRIGHWWDVSDWRERDGALAPHRIACGRKGGVNVWIFDEVSGDQPPYPSR